MNRVAWLLVFVYMTAAPLSGAAQIHPVIRGKYTVPKPVKSATMRPVLVKLSTLSYKTSKPLTPTRFPVVKQPVFSSASYRKIPPLQPGVLRPLRARVYPITPRFVLSQLMVRRDVFPGKDKIDAVIFDMDGTLLDSIPIWDHAATKYLRSRGIELPEEIQEYVKNISLLEGARYIKEQLNLPDTPEDLLAGCLQIVRRGYLEEVPAKPGVEQLFQQLRAQGIKICVATSSDPVLARGAFERLGLLEYIDFIIGCDEVGVGKKSPDVYNAALARLGTARKRTLVVEDALYALETAKKAGFPTAGVPDSAYPASQIQTLNATADYFFTSFEDILK